MYRIKKARQKLNRLITEHDNSAIKLLLRTDPNMFVKCIKHVDTLTTIPPLSVACKQDNLYAVQILLEYKADPNYSDIEHHDRPIIIAIQQMNYKILKTLLQSKVDPNKCNPNHSCQLCPAVPLAVAIIGDWINGVNLLIRHGADVNSGGLYKAPLFYAFPRRMDIVKILIARGANVNTSSLDNTEHIKCLILNAQVSKLKFIIRAGLYIFPHIDTIKNSYGYTIFKTRYNPAYAYLMDRKQVTADYNFYINKQNEKVNKYCIKELRRLMPKLLRISDIVNIIMCFIYRPMIKYGI